MKDENLMRNILRVVRKLMSIGELRYRGIYDEYFSDIDYDLYYENLKNIVDNEYVNLFDFPNSKIYPSNIQYITQKGLTFLYGQTELDSMQEKLFRDNYETKYSMFTYKTPEDMENIITNYNIDNMHCEINKGNNSKTYYLTGYNKHLAIEDCLKLNDYIYKAIQIEIKIPNYKIKEEDLSFNVDLYTSYRHCCYLSFSPLTKTGKIYKYPVMLHFHISDKLFGDIEYLNNCKIGKAHIVIWNNTHICYVINLSIINNELDINNITCTNFRERKKIYSYK